MGDRTQAGINRMNIRMMTSTALALVGVLAAGAPQVATAQAALEGRVGRLESEMRAVQRKVFPGGDGGTLVEPQITAPATDDTSRIGTPSTTALTDLTARVATLERQIATMTGQIEQGQYRLRQLEDQFAQFKKEAASADVAGSSGVVAVPSAPKPTTARDDAATPTPTPRASGSDSGGSTRSQQANAVEKPSTGDAPEDAYIYGYRLWAAKLYPEAEAQLKSMVATYPKHRRASFAQNLLGRSYLDDGKPSLASIALYDSYKKYPDGERAPDSLYFLGTALLKLNRPADACKVYAEFADVYGAKADADLKAKVAAARTTARCK